LYQSAFAADPLSPEAGRRWRYQVLARGASQPEMRSMEEFLGRRPGVRAVFEQIAAAAAEEA